jgi:hypothetical protein
VGVPQYREAHLVCVFPSHLGVGDWQPGGPPGFSIFCEVEILCAGWRCGGVNVLPLLRCVFSISPRFHYRSHAFCFLPLATIFLTLIFFLCGTFKDYLSPSLPLPSSSCSPLHPPLLFFFISSFYPFFPSSFSFFLFICLYIFLLFSFLILFDASAASNFQPKIIVINYNTAVRTLIVFFIIVVFPGF